MIKRTMIALAATGGVAALAFGGSAVSTAFTSTTATQYAEGTGATTGVSIDNGTFNATNLVPGAPATSVHDVYVHNNGSVPAKATVTFGAFTVKTNGSSGAPKASELIFNFNGQDLTAAQLENGTFPLPSTNPIPAGTYDTVTVTERLLQGTGNEWNGADAYLPYTVTLTAGN